ncbi:hypothetical protein T11_4168 [Trichinella zimbabwensis]|uniref:MULE transposase domain-containing protein n=1 Tax=Trichinella zimbabwensis TaxID=268475 RepID=A0A0V1GVE4_9BILA|nr:hypothetical protein T11_4168 [Trichinella zimbabwensis]
MEMTAQVINQWSSSDSQSIETNGGKRKNKLGTPLAAPTSLETLIIPEEFMTYALQQKLAIFRESRTWYVDGTFQSAPPLFCQIYVILAEALEGVHPVLHALLPDKSRSTYDQLFNMVKGIVPEANPRSTSCDFEMAAFNAIRTAFPSVRLHGYKNDADFALQAQMVIPLAFVPTEGIEQAINNLAGHLSDERQPLLDWFEESYVGRRNGRGGVGRSPMLPLVMWLIYHQDVDGDSRTNNYAEAAYRRLKAKLGMAHLTIWKLIDSLHKLVAGHHPPQKLQKYRDADERYRIELRVSITTVTSSRTSTAWNTTTT